MKFLVFISATVALSLACSASRSAGSSTLTNSTQPTQSPEVPVVATAQDKTACQLDLSQAPSLKGLKLRMTADEVLALIPGSKEDTEIKASLSKPPRQFGVAEFQIRPAKYEAAAEKFRDVKQIDVNLLDGRVWRFYFGFNGPEYPNVDKFVNDLIDSDSFPNANLWEPYVGMESLKALKCKEFEVTAFVGGKGGNLNYVIIKDLLAEKKLEDRERAAEAAATPKPSK